MAMSYDSFDDLAAALRYGEGAELIDEWEIAEIETEQARLRRRSLAEVWSSAMHRGDHVRVIAPFGRFGGEVDFVGDDFATVISGEWWWDVRLDMCVVQPLRRPQGGHTTRGGSRTFRARLSEFEATGEALHLCGETHDLAGSIVVAARDHVVLAGDAITVVPLTLIAAVRRRM